VWPPTREKGILLRKMGHPYIRQENDRNVEKQAWAGGK